jgi:colicin import membrane protein
MYMHRMNQTIKDRWVWAGADKSLKADVAWIVLPEGQIADIRTVESSGDPAYDKQAETALRAASPLPPVPDECKDEFKTLGFQYTFEPN